MNISQKIHIFDDKESLCAFALKRWQEALRQAVLRNGRFTVALSGGKTPVGFYQRLAKQPGLPWSQTHLFWVDERCIDSSSEESNYRLIRKIIINRISIPPENIHLIDAGKGKPRDAAKKYEEHLNDFFLLERGELPEFDLMILGIGEDGHTASLFPGDLIDPYDHFVIPVSLPHLKCKRVSLTLSALNGAREVIFLVTGENKAAILKTIIEDKSRLPAALVQPENGNLFFLSDRQAARLLKKESPRRKRNKKK